MAVSNISSAPSNIALIKYMGKIEGAGNKPTNSSLSYTLEHLRTYVKITQDESLTQDTWHPLQDPQLKLYPITLSETGEQKFLKHFDYLKTQWGIKNFFRIESANNFPSDCGLASSASSFAALTKCAAEVFQKIKPQSPSFQDQRQLSRWSRLGSGSSCRSFFTPWALWAGDGAEKVELPYKDLLHQVVIVEDTKKSVSSSEAHVRVAKSEMFKGRIERAQDRLSKLVHLFREKKWAQVHQIVWDEFWDMHTLFSTSQPPFIYMKGGTIEVLELLMHEWETKLDGPLVTMDAGANIHLLYRADQVELYKKLETTLKAKYQVLGSLEQQVQA